MGLQRRRPDTATVMRVQYSLSVADETSGRRMMDQLELSLGSLREVHPAGTDVDVAVVVHGEPPTGLPSLLERHAVRLEPRPPVAEQLAARVGSFAPVLAPMVSVHKFLTLAPLAAVAPRRVLALDCDTVVRGPLTRLVPDRPRPTLLAREEVHSRRCRFGERTAYLDESALRTTTQQVAGHDPAPAFNTGVMGLVDVPWHRAAALERRYLGWLVRFATWMALHPGVPGDELGADVVDVGEVHRLVRGPSGERLRALAAPYPSANRWLLEEVAAWAAVGGEPALRHEAFPAHLVAQGVETTLPSVGGRAAPVVSHYFSSNEAAIRDLLSS